MIEYIEENITIIRKYLNKRKKDISISISDVSKLNREISINHKENKWLDLAKTSIEWYRNK